MTEAQHDMEPRPPAPSGATEGASPRFSRVQSMIADGRCVVLDGAVGTELPRVAPEGSQAVDERLWGTRALIDTPDLVA